MDFLSGDEKQMNNNEHDLPQWVLTLAHLGGLLFVLIVLLGLGYVFWNLIAGYIEEKLIQREENKALKEWQATLNNVEVGLRDFS